MLPRSLALIISVQLSQLQPNLRMLRYRRRPPNSGLFGKTLATLRDARHDDADQASSSARTLGNRVLLAALTMVGKDYQPSSDLPLGLIAMVVWTRLIWRLRGLARFRRPVFIASGVRFRGKRHISLGSNCTLERGVVIDGYARRGVQIGARTRLGEFTLVSCTSHLSLYGEGFSIGDDSGIGPFSTIGAAGGVTVGSNVIMGPLVSFHSQEHVFDDPATPIRLQGTTEKGIVVGDDCWIGARVTFLDGSHLSDGCVVAAGAVVRGEFAPLSVVAGIPARIVGRRTPVGTPEATEPDANLRASAAPDFG